MTLFSFLVFEKNYSGLDAEETCLRYEGGFDIPEDVRKDIKEYNEKARNKVNECSNMQKIQSV